MTNIIPVSLRDGKVENPTVICKEQPLMSAGPQVCGHNPASGGPGRWPKNSGWRLKGGVRASQTDGKRSRQVRPSPRDLSSHLPQEKMVATPVLVLVTSTFSTSQPEQ